MFTAEHSAVCAALKQYVLIGVGVGGRIVICPLPVSDVEALAGNVFDDIFGYCRWGILPHGIARKSFFLRLASAM